MSSSSSEDRPQLSNVFYMTPETEVNPGVQLTQDDIVYFPPGVRQFAMLPGLDASFGTAADRDDECMICMDPLESNQDSIIHSAVCRWSFHPDCLSTWTTPQIVQDGETRCPACRGVVNVKAPWTPRDVRHLFRRYVAEVQTMHYQILYEAQSSYALTFSAYLDLGMDARGNDDYVISDILDSAHRLRDDVIAQFHIIRDDYWRMFIKYFAKILLDVMMKRHDDTEYYAARDQLMYRLRHFRVTVVHLFDLNRVVQPRLNEFDQYVQDYHRSGDQWTYSTGMRRLRREIRKNMADSAHVRMEEIKEAVKFI